MFCQRHRHTHSVLHLLAWLGTLLLGWELGRRGLTLSSFKSGEGFINFPGVKQSSGNEPSSTSAQPPRSTPFDTEEVGNGLSEQPI